MIIAKGRGYAEASGYFDAVKPVVVLPYQFKVSGKIRRTAGL